MDSPSFRLSRSPVAIIGVAGIFPQAADVREFWRNIVAGRDCITDVPESSWSLADHYDPDVLAEDKTYARRGGFLAPTVFDPAEFAMPPSVVDSIGLVQLLSLQVARDVLDDARCRESGWYDPRRTGVVLGVCGQNSTLFPLAARLVAPDVKKAALGCGVPEREAERIARRFASASPAWTEDSFPGILSNVVTGRIANRFGLGAANCTVDAACASSLAALRMAVDELVEGRADLMITGGCDADNSTSAFVCFSKTPALSLSGNVKPFDRDADGTLLGEGIGMLALKRLADAERDGDRVYAVLRGIGNSSDGQTGSIYAPDADGQATALRRAYTDADVAPGEVGLIEAHGTGTRTGDAVELQALRTVLGPAGSGPRTAIGSVKSQIGHTKAAAGAAGLIKAALALHHKVLPPSINVDSVTDAVDGSSLYVNTRARPWIRDPRQTARRGGVSSFGFGGVNFHVVLEEHSPSDPHARPLHRTPQALLWHAPGPDALLAVLREGAEPADGGPVPQDHARLGVLAEDPADREALLSEAVARLADGPAEDSWSLGGRVHYRRTGLPSGTKAAVLFAGQGSQYVDMGLAAVLGMPPVRRAFDDANALWADEEDTLAEVVYPEPGRRDPASDTARLRRTAYAQPAVGALAMGQYAFLSALGFAPDAALGHSSGEVTALWAAGSLSDSDCLLLARRRGQAMQPPPGTDDDAGAMAAVRLSAEEWRERAPAHRELTLCNINAPDELVVGGPVRAVEALAAESVRRGGPAVHRLPVATAFHTPLVSHAVDTFAEALAQVGIRPPVIWVPANTPGAAYGADADANRRVLAQQIVRPVDFAGRVRELYADGFRVFVECGPKQVLSRLVLRTVGDGAVEAVPTDTGPGTDSAAALKDAALRLAVLGFAIGDINRHDAPPPAPSPEPSPVARLLEGPSFAVAARRAAYAAECEAETATSVAASRDHDAQVPAQREGARTLSDPPLTTGAEPAALTPPDAPDAAASAAAAPVELARAAAAQLDLHNQFLSGQLATARSLAQALVRGDGQPPDPALLTCIEAVRDHSAALGRAHVRGQEVLLELARTGLDTGRSPVPHADTLPVGPEVRVSDKSAGQGAEPGRAPAPVPVDPTPPGPPVPAPAALSAPPTDVPGIERILRELVAEKTGYTVEMVDPALDIQTDLGIDSLKQVEIASEAWRRYPTLPREEIYRFAQARTVAALAALLADMAATAADQPSERPPVTSGRACFGLRTLPEVDLLADAYPPRAVALLVDDGSALADALANSLGDEGWAVRRLALPGVTARASAEHLTDWREETLRDRIGRVLRTDNNQLDLCLIIAGREPAPDTAATAAATARLGHAVLIAKHTVPALKAAAVDGHRGGILAVTQLDGALGLAGSGGQLGQALYGGLGGLVKAVGVEEPDLFCRAVDIAPDIDPVAAAGRVLREAADAAPEREIAWDGTARRAPALSPDPAGLLPAGPAAAPPGPEDLLLVTGGARGITAWCLTALATRHPCRFLLLGRTPLEELPVWAAGLDGLPALRDACAEQARAEGRDPAAPDVGEAVEARAQRLDRQREMHETLRTLHRLGAAAEYVSADVGDAVAVRTALAPYRDRVTGVIHGAGVLADQPLTSKDPRDVERVIGTKLTGLHHVLHALPADRLRHLVLFTSVSGIYGNGRQSDYATANEALNRFACAWKAAHPATRVAALAWGPWRGGMASERAQELFQQLGVPLLSREEGCAHFVGQFAPERSDDLITVLGPLTSVFTPAPLPADGAVLLRNLSGLAGEPLLGDHRIDGLRVLPMTAAIGWGIHAVERTGAGQPVTEVRNFSVRKGLVLNGSHPARARTVLRPQPSGGVAVATYDDAARQTLRYEGVFSTDADVSGTHEPLTPLAVPPPPYRRHPAYDDGFLFHGPLLQGLGPVLFEDDRRLTVVAHMPDPPFAHGAYAGARYSAALADLLLQVAALQGRRTCGHRCLPVSVERVELLAPLPDDEPFVITAELRAHGPLEMVCTVVACGPDGTVLQRWSGLQGIVAAPQLGSRAAWPAEAPDATP
ncbi:SDR family NAD(P)-dependent oxidoreductase [Streptomyces sp. NPDC045456]|uniref:SDR family NAD(P)-dependent oxidoreductase n=1 Tax=Streptomyces sp. NPDC045456 TaxID=3155254 RepID=UPI0033E5246C